MSNIILLQAQWINNSHRPLTEPSSSLYKVPHTLLCAQIISTKEKELEKWKSCRKTLHHFTKASRNKATNPMPHPHFPYLPQQCNTEVRVCNTLHQQQWKLNERCTFQMKQTIQHDLHPVFTHPGDKLPYCRQKLVEQWNISIII